MELAEVRRCVYRMAVLVCLFGALMFLLHKPKPVFAARCCEECVDEYGSTPNCAALPSSMDDPDWSPTWNRSACGLCFTTCQSCTGCFPGDPQNCWP